MVIYTKQSPIVGPSTPVDLDDLIFWTSKQGAHRTEELESYFATLWEGCKKLNFDFVVLAAQWDLETDTGRSPWWRDGLNPAGLGITGDPAQNAKAQTWDSGEKAAVAHLAHMCAYVFGRVLTTWPDSWPDPEVIDERFKLVPRTGPKKPARTLEDLNQTWAIDKENNYHGKLAARANRIVEIAGTPVVTIPPGEDEIPMADNYTYGNVKHPPFQDRLIPDIQNRAWDDLGPRDPVGACQHSMLGSLWGTDGYFRTRVAGLTDFGIGGSTDGASDGLILRWNDPTGKAHTVKVGNKNEPVSANRAPWANGGSDGLEGDGPAYVRKLGVAAINRDLVSIERSDGGIERTPMSPKQFASICALTAHWFDVAKVPWDRFPLNPEFDLVTHFLHLEFATKNCPFAPVTSRIDEIQDRVRAILKAGQIAIDEPTVPPPGPVEPDKSWPHGWTTEALAARFDVVELVLPDGTKRPQRFDENGPISNAWVARANELGITNIADMPPPLAWNRLIDSDRLQIDSMVFDGSGSDNWALYRPAAEVAWRWIR